MQIYFKLKVVIIWVDYLNNVRMSECQNVTIVKSQCDTDIIT